MVRRWTTFFILTFLWHGLAIGAPANFSYQGQIIKPNGQPLEGNSVTFYVEILSPGPSECVLFEEYHTINMSGSNGLFALEIGGGTQSGSDYEDVNSLSDALSNSIGTVSPTTCVVGPNYTPAPGDGRQMRVTFDDGSGPNTLATNHQIISVPYADSASSVDGLTSADLLTINNGGSFVLTQANLEWIFANGARYAELQALINGTSTQYLTAAPTGDVSMNSQKIVDVADPTIGTDAANKNYVDANIAGQPTDSATLSGLAGAENGHVMYWNGTQWTAGAPAGDSTKLPLAGGTMSGDILMGNNDVSNANNITANGSVSANGLSTGTNLAFYNTGNYVGFQAPAGATDLIWTLPGSDGSANQALSTDGAGTLSWRSYVETASNQGAGGVGPYKQLNSGDLEFKNINAGSNKVTIFDDTVNDEIDIDVDESNFDPTAIPNTAGGNIAAGNVQAAINELDTEKVAKAGDAMTGALTLNAQNEVRFADADSSNYVGFAAPATVGVNLVWELPDVDGSTGQVLETDGAGVLRWRTLAAVGESNTASNQGTAGIGVFDNKNGVDFEFRNINDDGNGKISVVLDGANQEIDLSVVESALDQTAITNTPAGNIAATNIQAAINELDVEKVGSGRTITSGVGMTGGGDLSGNLTLDVGAGAGLVGNADDIAVGAGAGITVNADDIEINIPGVADFASTVAATDSILMYDASAPGMVEIQRSAFVLSEAEVDAYANNNGYALDTDVLKKDGSVALTSSWDVGGTNTITNLPAPSLGSDAATKTYVDTAVGGISTDTIEDADGNTLVQVEEGANDDTIRFDTAGSQRMVIDSTGNIGLGTDTPDTHLHIAKANAHLKVDGRNGNTGSRAGTVSITGARSSTTKYGSVDFYNVDSTGSSSEYLGASIVAYRSGTDAASLWFQTATSGSASTKMTIRDNGRVGIGTQNPAVELDVKGTIQIGDGGETCSLAANAGMIRYNSGNLDYCNGSSWTTLGVSGAGLTNLNGQSGSSQSFAVDAAGTAPAINSATDTHTLSIPLANGAGVTSGTISKSEYDAFDAKLDSVVGETLTSAQFWVGDVSNVAAAVSMSGDATMDTAGSVTIANDAITSAKISDGEIVDADISATADITRTKLASGTANRLIVNDGTGEIGEAAAITANRALTSDGSGIPVASTVTDTELAYLSGVTSAVQTQLNGMVQRTGDTMTGQLLVDGGSDQVQLAVEGDTLQTNNLVEIRNSASAVVASVSADGTVSAATDLTTKSYVDSAVSGISTDEIADADNNTKIQVEEGANDDTIRFDTAGAERMVIDSSGNLGVGTNSPNAMLDVAGGAVFDTDTLVIDSVNNRVGIGEGSPAFALSVAGAGKFNAGVILGGTGSWRLRSQGGNDDFVIYDSTNTVERVFIDGLTGNLGIGTTNPASKLSIDGSLDSTTIGDESLVVSDLTVAPTGNQSSTADRISSDSVVREDTGTFDIGRMVGSRGQAVVSGTARNIDSAIGLQGETLTYGSSAITNLAGVKSNSYNESNVTNHYGVLVDNYTELNTTQNQYGVYVTQGINSGIVQNRYGLYIAAGSGTPSTNDFGVYQESASRDNYFAGNVGIGSESPRSLLEVAGDIQIGNSSVACDGTKAGSLRYNTGNVEFCDGSTWTAFGTASGGEVNTASNEGAGGIGIYDGKTGSNIELRNIAAASSKVTVALDGANKEVDIDVDESNFDPTAIPNNAAGNIAATTLQGAINELDTEKLGDVTGSALADGTVWVGDGSNQAQEVAVTGDVAISNTGATTIQANAVESSMILDGEIVNADINASAGIAATKIGTGNVNNTELDFLDGVTSALQTQLDGKVDLGGDTMTGQLLIDGGANEVQLAIEGDLLQTANLVELRNSSSVVVASVSADGTVSAATDLTTKSYVDSAVSGISTDEIADADNNTKIQVEEGANDDTIRFDTAGSERMVIAPSGNVGIGTNSPGQALDVRGLNSLPATSGSTQTGTLRVSSTGTTMTLDSGVHSGSGAWIQATQRNLLGNTFNLLLNPNGGDVGIGTTSPATALDVNGTVSSSALSVNGGVVGGNTIFSSTLGRVSHSWNGASSTLTLTNDNSTNNSSTPLATFERSRFGVTSDIQADFGGYLRLSLEGATNASSIDAARINWAYETAQTNDTTDRDTYLSFSTALDDTLSEQVRITSSGRMGIGTTAPAVALDVDTGSINAAEICDENNANCFDISSGIGSGTGDFLADGSIPMSGAIRLPDGATTTPSLTFSDDIDTGIWSNIDDLINFSTGGTNRVQIGNSGLQSNHPVSTGRGNSSLSAVSYGFTGDTDTGIYSSGDNTVSINTDGAERLTVDATGDVGIGTTTPASALQVNNGASGITVGTVGPRISDQTALALSGPASAQTKVELNSTRGGADLQASTFEFYNNITQIGEIQSRTGTTNTRGALLFSTNNGTLAERMRIDENGNIGIGTSTPAVELDVNSGTINAALICDENNANCIDLSGGGGGGGAILDGGNSTGANLTVGTNDSFDLDFETNGTSKMTLTTSGKLGIGTTAPSSRLTVVGSPVDGSLDDIRIVASRDTASSTVAFEAKRQRETGGYLLDGDKIFSLIGQSYNGVDMKTDTTAGGDSASIEFYVAANHALNDIPGEIRFNTADVGESNDTTRMTIASNGYVGIGDTTPGATLQITTPVGDTNPLIQSNHQGTGHLMQLSTSGVSKLRISNEGYLGIGDYVTPTIPLYIGNLGADVLGRIRVHTEHDSSSAGSSFEGYRKRTTGTGAVQSGDDLLRITARGHDDTGWVHSDRGILSIEASETWTSSANGTQMKFYVTPNGATSTSEVMAIENNGDVGIGTSSPRTALDVNGSIASAPADAEAANTIDFANSNFGYTAQSCGDATFNLHNMKDGATYTMAVQGTSSGTCDFNAFSDAGSTPLTVKFPPSHAASTAGTETLYSFVVIGSSVYVAWIPGYTP